MLKTISTSECSEEVLQILCPKIKIQQEKDECNHVLHISKGYGIIFAFWSLLTLENAEECYLNSIAKSPVVILESK